MARRTGVLRRHAVLAYFGLTLGISWSGVFLLLGPGGSPVSGKASAAVPLVYVAMLAGPAVAALVMTALVGGRAGLRGLLARLLTWRVAPRWYAVVLLTAPLLATLVLFALSHRSTDFLPAVVNTMAGEFEATTEGRAAVWLSMVGAGVMVAVLEELGWTGFATPELRRRHGIVATGVMLGVVWGAWHFPVFWERDTFSGAAPLALLLVRLFTFLVAYRVAMVWVHDRTGSLLLPVLMHAALFAAPQAQVLSPVTIMSYDVAAAAVLWMIIGIVAARGRQARRPPAAPWPHTGSVEGRVP